MKTLTFTLLVATIAQACMITVAAGNIAAVAGPEARAWLDHLIPLPKEARIERKLTAAVTNIFVDAWPRAGAIARQATAELREALGQADVPNAPATADGASISIILGLADADNQVNGIHVPDAHRLRGLPNREQAYLIRTVNDSALVIAALDERGLYYGVQTLKQLIAPFRGATNIVIPLVNITDWPDMPERGTWNAGIRAPGYIAWRAAMKLNFEHLSHGMDLRPDAPRCPPLPLELMATAQARAFNLMPHCPHYDFWRSDILWLKQPDGTMVKVVNKDFFPAELTGQGDSARNPMSIKRPGYQTEGRCPCASSLLLQQYLTEWMLSAAQQGVREVCLWLTEYQPSYCSCEKCLLPDGRLRQIQLETAASVKAIQETHKTYPDFTGRILLTIQSAWHLPADYWSKDIQNPTNWYELDCQECLDLIPDDPGIKVEKMYGASRACNAYAEAGNWLSVYHSSFLLGIDWNWRGACPFRFNNPPETACSTIRGWVDNHYAGSYSAACVGDGVMEMSLAGYTLAMLAEWSWNVNGRTPEEFMRAWLTRQGYKDIEKALAWMNAMLPLEQAAVAGLRHTGAMTDAIRRRAPPQMPGAGFEGATITTAPDRFDAMLNAARDAGTIARAINAPDLQAESEYVAAAIAATRAVYFLAQTVAEAKTAPAPDLEPRLNETRGAFQNLAQAAANSLAAWPDFPPAVRAQFAQKATAFSTSQTVTLESAVKTEPENPRTAAASGKDHDQ